jgi:DNA-binding NarL/FixJ family response regulator
MISVVIVDDHEIINMGLQLLITMTDDITCLGTAKNASDGVAMVLAETPDVVVMDVSMPGGDGIGAVERILVDQPSANVLMLTSSADPDHIRRSLVAGARGYVLKHSDPDVILDAIRAIADGGAPLDPIAGSVLLKRNHQQQSEIHFSPREVEVLKLLAKGLANKQIAANMGITTRTVKAHLTHIFAQLNVSDRTHAALWASKNGFGQDSSSS